MVPIQFWTTSSSANILEVLSHLNISTSCYFLILEFVLWWGVIRTFPQCQFSFSFSQTLGLTQGDILASTSITRSQRLDFLWLGVSRKSSIGKISIRMESISENTISVLLHTLVCDCAGLCYNDLHLQLNGTFVFISDWSAMLILLSNWYNSWHHSWICINDR